MRLIKRAALLLIVILQAPQSWGASSQLFDQLGVYVTPATDNDQRFTTSYSEALKTLRGHAAVVWILESWSDIETAPGQYDWTSLDFQLSQARQNGFQVGLRIQVVLCGNDAHKQQVAVSRIPRFYNQDMRSKEFQQRSVEFYRQVAERYKGSVRYVAVGNTVNKYFELNPNQWDGFVKCYDSIVDAIHTAAPGTLVVADITPGAQFFEQPELLRKYISFFAQSHDDLIGLVFYFITNVYFGEDFKNFNAQRLQEVLTQLHSMAPGKKLYIIETSCFSTHPKTGKDISAVQARYVEMLFEALRKEPFLAGICWWQLYDAKDLPDVPWDIRASFGFFDSDARPKPAWRAWTGASAASGQ